VRNDLEWTVPATLFVALQFVAGAILDASLGFVPNPPLLLYVAWGALAGFYALGLFACLEVIRMWRRGEPKPVPALIDLARRNTPQIAIAGYGCLLIAMQLAALTWLKSMLPVAVPFWADPYLARFDRAVFGTEPWRLLHHLSPLGEWVVDGIYLSWFPVKLCMLVALLALPPRPAKSRAMLAYFLTIGLFGVIGQYALSSAGPIFNEPLGFGRDFSSLHMTSTVADERTYLLNVYLNRNEAFGSGISAMPSVHVALSTWIALSIQSVWRRLALAGWAFYAIILFGSVYLGWHYAADGIAGTAAALVSWWLSAKILSSDCACRLKLASVRSATAQL
jgi:hypothetical protein